MFVAGVAQQLIAARVFFRHVVLWWWGMPVWSSPASVLMFRTWSVPRDAT